MNKKTLLSIVCALSAVTCAINAADGSASNDLDPILTSLTPTQRSIRRLRKPVRTHIETKVPKELNSKIASLAGALGVEVANEENRDILRKHYFADTLTELRRESITLVFAPFQIPATESYVKSVALKKKKCNIYKAIQRAGNEIHRFENLDVPNSFAVEELEAGRITQEQFMRSITLGLLALYMHENNMLSSKHGIVIPAVK